MESPLGQGAAQGMALSLDPLRIMARCDALAQLSEQHDGLTRVYLSAESRVASDLVMRWMREAGMNARLDALGNVVGRYDGERADGACLILGSHLDTVRNAGKYDGMLGVVTAIECVHALAAAGRRLAFAIEVIGFGDEEGVRFGATLIGSRAVAGTLDPEIFAIRDRDGISLRQALHSYGLDPAGIGDAAHRPRDVLAYVELHIEQGPILDAEGLAVGVVSAISGATRFAIEIDGLAGHAGTVPMHLRQDALAAAAECVLAIERRCTDTPELVGTVGKIEALPGAVNVIPGKATFTLDIRSPQDAVREAAAQDIMNTVEQICARRNVTWTATKSHAVGVASCAPWLIEQLSAAIRAEGLPVRVLPSGAGHDGQAMIDLCDIGMLFVRCCKGWDPLESTCRHASLSIL